MIPTDEAVIHSRENKSRCNKCKLLQIFFIHIHIGCINANTQQHHVFLQYMHLAQQKQLYKYNSGCIWIHVRTYPCTGCARSTASGGDPLEDPVSSLTDRLSIAIQTLQQVESVVDGKFMHMIVMAVHRI